MFLFAFIGSTAFIQQVLKFKAYQNEKASKLAVFQYLSTPYQIILDILVIHSQITIYQVIGVTIILSVQAYKTHEYKNMKDEKEPDKDD